MKLRQDLALLLPRLREQDVDRFCAFHERWGPHLETIASVLYDRLSPQDQSRFLLWFLKRWGKIDLVNPVERCLYDATVERVRTEARPAERLGDKSYRLRDFASQGWDFRMLGYDWWLGVHDILYNQYEGAQLKLAPGDVIIDAGAFIGDTAVFFHHKLEGRCSIHSFELLDENLRLLLHNLERNGVRDDQVVVNQLALSDRTGDEIAIADGATQGSTSMFGPADRGVRVQTVTIDDYVMRLQLPRVDFIKMDIEGAETQALQGARQTIRHFRPKLAICLYHRWNDLFTVPQAILETGVAYDFGFKWVQLRDGWEAVLHATPCADAAARAPVRGLEPGRSDEALAAALAVLTRACGRRGARLQRQGRGQPATAASGAMQGMEAEDQIQAA